MNKTMLAVVMLTLLIGFGCLSQQSQTSKISFVPEVKGCAASNTSEANATKSFGKEREPEIKIEKNGVIYSRAISHLCCRTVKLEYKIEDSTINIYEIWNGIGCKCICFSEIAGKLENLPAGKYTINVYETGTKPDGKPMEEKLIISKDVSIS
ncbi:MAG: hypothetical protein H0Z28_05855 [Archaeoglobus sp.]|nr:hypothetical protein [Archaeoglobus sp.]